ncbi:tRNA (uridine(54)-C5)-methyltransferase TrmA [Colwellia sp. 4_MG-2023]|jgi:tRNA (uracil-5-)-methyltransferase|uniref:tRNA (uridine(54)-C5)-methyltransferase TrmA n=1 Tax=unclassified Colwellia TaxID=196834 RepID=UPI001C086620|nr:MULTISPECIES: tRNA (uridine(54)-C5)-methyltransferase TrmA [unclassified Colwellia]MBU2924876.1 tRNA (uridine(54)-C5)-methyltransferase TrmA [Colwellia sp. C2M11]MDO6508814.1 tRNA (uridine(54)-C5)-methyltransferase TrmA [Colwellia sp. 5_MG-2023]MDO6557497.1 tRNA (uridine(54)-C5)-methyltransferase TrmA [Colwellia sp. 4_MG-2023]MDO6654194.1 tRNA (uridine(54)-C5)-methyltransferase TrmA [Colwellia sp. 3_MG-2023]MDO6667228.1 tRNA (uridine(54)-C5)-methyltransferase TrmA [Colwellia sp. 2_MG-2023]
MFSHIHPDNYEQQLSEKNQEMTALFSCFNNLPSAEIFPSKPLNYRLRAEFRVWHQGDDLYYIMFNSETKEKFRVDDFPVASQLINQAMKALLIAIKDIKELRYKLFQVDFLSTLSGELLISMLYHKPLEPTWEKAATELKVQLSKIAPVDIIGRAKKQKIILDKDYVMESLRVGDKKFIYQQVENSFTQPNGSVNEQMLLWAQKATVNAGGDLIELYCGNGNFSIALAQNFARVLGTEISKTSVKSAQVNITANNIDNINIVRMSSEEFSQAMNGERKFRRLEGFDLTTYNYDTVLVDPPRAGLDKDSVELVSRFNTIIYISCNPNTLKENLIDLTKTHTIEKFALFDQFPYTSHIEVGMVLTRK